MPVTRLEVWHRTNVCGCPQEDNTRLRANDASDARVARPDAPSQTRHGSAPRCGNIFMEFTEPDGWTGEAVARVLRTAMAEAHEGGTLTCRDKLGRHEVYQWTAGELTRRCPET